MEIGKEYEQYVKKELIKEFEKMCKKNSLDFYSCGCVLTAHLCMSTLMNNKIGILDKKKLNPKMAWERAISQTPYHSGMSANMTKQMIIRYSKRGKEFKEWCDNLEKMETLYELEKENGKSI